MANHNTKSKLNEVHRQALKPLSSVFRAPLQRIKAWFHDRPGISLVKSFKFSQMAKTNFYCYDEDNVMDWITTDRRIIQEAPQGSPIKKLLAKLFSQKEPAQLLYQRFGEN